MGIEQKQPSAAELILKNQEEGSRRERENILEKQKRILEVKEEFKRRNSILQKMAEQFGISESLQEINRRILRGNGTEFSFPACEVTDTKGGLYDDPNHYWRVFGEYGWDAGNFNTSEDYRRAIETSQKKATLYIGISWPLEDSGYNAEGKHLIVVLIKSNRDCVVSATFSARDILQMREIDRGGTGGFIRRGGFFREELSLDMPDFKERFSEALAKAFENSEWGIIPSEPFTP